MVVLVRAEAVAELAGAVAEDVDDAVLAQGGERPVDGGEPDPRALSAQALVESLRGDVVAHALKLGDDADALRRRAQAAPREQALGREGAWLPARHAPVSLAAVGTRIILILRALAFASFATALTACGGSAGGGAGSGQDGAGARLEVVAGFYPLAYAAQEIGADRVDVANLTPPGVEPHDFELSPRDVEQVRSADVVLYLGHGFQPALEDAVAGAGGRAVDLLEGLPLVDGDPHVWLDPLLYARVAERIGAQLGAAAGAGAFADRLRELDGELRSGLAGCDRRVIVTSHAAFAYLARRYGLEQVAVAGLSPEAEPAPRELERVVEAIRESGATTVFFEPLVSSKLAETVAREAGVETAVMNPLEGLTEEEATRGEDYFSLMRANLAALRKGLGC